MQAWAALSRFELGRDGLTRSNQIGDDALIDIEITFVFAQVSDLVTFIEHTPDFRAKTERVWQNLEHYVAVMRSKSLAPQSCKGQRVRGVVATLERIHRIGRILEPRKRRTF